MSTLTSNEWRQRSVLLVGLGGLGCPVAAVLTQAGVGRLGLCDDDVVDESNLHRQVLYDGADVGVDKLERARAALRSRFSQSPTQLSLHRTRLLPHNARDLIGQYDVVVEGADNFATKFLAADAAHLERKPIVHGSAIRWIGTAWAVSQYGRPCYRCLFEDIPTGEQASCDSAGVLGPVVGLVGGLLADLCLSTLSSGSPPGGLWSLDGLSDQLRKIDAVARVDCPLCGEDPCIFDIQEARYLQGLHAA